MDLTKDIFISYRNDGVGNNFATRISNDLKQSGYSVYFNPDEARSGDFPERLQQLVEQGLVDYVAMDIKNSRIRYHETCGAEVLPQIEKSVRHLMNGNIDYEFRTTVCKPLHALNDMKDIGLWLKGAKRYFIQQFIDSGNVPDKNLLPFSPEEMKQLENAVLPYIPNTRVRGV